MPKAGTGEPENPIIPHPSIVRLSSSALNLFDKLKALSAKPKGSLPKGSRRSPLSQRGREV